MIQLGGAFDRVRTSDGRQRRQPRLGGNLAASAKETTSLRGALLMKGEIAEARRYAEEAVAQAQAARDPFWLAVALGDVSLVYGDTGAADRDSISPLMCQTFAWHVLCSTGPRIVRQPTKGGFWQQTPTIMDETSMTPAAYLLRTTTLRR
jgi:hypothetical protein